MIDIDDLPAVKVGTKVLGHYERGRCGQQYTRDNPLVSEVVGVLPGNHYRLSNSPSYWSWYPDELELVDDQEWFL